jgi:hypothetical protein
MVREVPVTKTSARSRQAQWGRAAAPNRGPLAPWFCAWATAMGLALVASPHARAAMNFCAAPALQTSERTNAVPGAGAWMKRVAAQLNDQPKPLARLHTEGTLPHEGIYDRSVEAEQDLTLMRDAALVWRATGDDRYLKLVDRFLLAWTSTYQPSFNPIDETHFDALILAYDLTASALPVKTRNAAVAFIGKLASGYIARIDGQTRPLTGTFRNNWQSHRVKLVAMAAFALDDRKLIASAQRLFVEQVGNNIAPGGETVDFGERDALHYVVYDLDPLVMAALAARRHNRNWLNERGANGATLGIALDWLTPYALGEKTHEEFVHSSVAFDAKRREAGVPGYEGQWDPAGAGELFHLAARLSGRYAPVAQRIAPVLPAWLAVCLPFAARG